MSQSTKIAQKKLAYMLRFYRRMRGLSQQDMALILNISYRNLQRIEAGLIEPKLDTLMQISVALDIDVAALIRPTNLCSYKVKELLSAHESSTLNELTLISEKSAADIDWAKNLIQQDKVHIPGADSNLFVQMNGNNVTLSSELIKLTGVGRPQINIDDYTIFGTSAERWELVFRHNLKMAVIENTFAFPTGIKTFKVFHHRINPNPENPTAESYIEDITARVELERWISEIKGRVKK